MLCCTATRVAHANSSDPLPAPQAAAAARALAARIASHAAERTGHRAACLAAGMPEEALPPLPNNKPPLIAIYIPRSAAYAAAVLTALAAG